MPSAPALSVSDVLAQFRLDILESARLRVAAERVLRPDGVGHASLLADVHGLDDRLLRRYAEFVLAIEGLQADAKFVELGIAP